VSPDGSWIVSADDICYFNIWDVATGAIQTTFRADGGHINACAFSPDGAWIVSAGDKGGLQMRDTVTGRERAVLGDDATPMLGCAVSPDGTWIVTIGEDREITVWDAVTQLERWPSSERQAARDSGASGSASAAGSTEVQADAVDHRVRGDFSDETESAGGCAISPDGAWIVSTCADGTLGIWDAATGTRQATLRGHAGPVNACAVSADARYIASGGDDRTLRIWDAATGIELAMLDLPFEVTALAFHPSEPTVACGDSAGRVHLADIVGLPQAVTNIQF
jgi:WD40 repeat protein